MHLLATRLNFNPLHHEGGDAERVYNPPEPDDFNPLHHEGGDLEVDGFDFEFKISIHSTTRVETLHVSNLLVSNC